MYACSVIAGKPLGEVAQFVLAGEHIQLRLPDAGEIHLHTCSCNSDCVTLKPGAHRSSGGAAIPVQMRSPHTPVTPTAMVVPVAKNCCTCAWASMD